MLPVCDSEHSQFGMLQASGGEVPHRVSFHCLVEHEGLLYTSLFCALPSPTIYP